jgi:hypothetical protein
MPDHKGHWQREHNSDNRLLACDWFKQAGYEVGYGKEKKRWRDDPDYHCFPIRGQSCIAETQSSAKE